MLIFLYGADYFRSRQKLIEYKTRFHEKYGPAGNLTMVDCEENKSFNFPEIVSAPDLFSPVRLIIIKSLLVEFPTEQQEELVKFLKNNGNVVKSQEIVVIFFEEEPKKTGALFKFLEKNAKIEKFEKLEGIRLVNWTEARLKEINPKIKISKKAVERLVAYVGGDMEYINSELLKLANYKNEISEEDIDLLVPAGIFSNIFEVVEAASRGNKKIALQLLHQQLANKEDPFYILSMYAYHFRNLLKIGECFWKGIPDKFAISKKTGLHPYVVQKSIPQLKNFNPAKLKKAFSQIQKIDLEAKTGKADIRLELDLFLAKL
jgi:DNA polymerase III delta subunit